MKVKVAVLLGIQGVMEVEVTESAPGQFDMVATPYGEIDVRSTAISGSQDILTATLKDKVVRSAEQAMATIVGNAWKPAESDGAKPLAMAAMPGSAVN